jgi:hypothetical protein
MQGAHAAANILCFIEGWHGQSVVSAALARQGEENPHNRRYVGVTMGELANR